MPKIAVCSGTFDPITKGHVDIALRAAELFDEVVLAVAGTNYKNNLFTTEERCALAEEALRGAANVRIMPFDGLLVDFCHSIGAAAIVRGLRSATDFDREFQMELLNRNLNGGIDTMFFMSDSDFLFLSSSVIKNAAAVGGDVSHMVPAAVYAELEKKFPALLKVKQE